MGILSRCFCDPFKLTYVSAIVTSIEAVVFGVLNIVFLCMYKCVIKPPSDVALGFDRFWNYYFFDNESCIEKDYDPPWWTNGSKYAFPLSDEERSLTTPHDNFVYQATYLCLHAAWFITAMILIYGNARKQWGYYLPWLLVSTAITVMDVTVSAFCITDMVTITSDQYSGAMFWILALYFRLFLIFLINLSEFASAFNAFCKARHKRSKQERQRQKMAKAHEEELAKVEAAAEARARAQMAEEYQLRESQQQQQFGGNVEMRPKIPPPVPKKPAAPPELRPFSYLNPAFRPNDPTDVEGMRAHSALPEDLAVRPMGTPTPLQGPYFPSDGYDRPQGVEGFPRRHDSMRAYRTQMPPPGLRRFSSTRIHPSYARRPMEPTPDYDLTMRRGPSSIANQSKCIHDFLVVSNDSSGGDGDGHVSLQVPATDRNNTDFPLTYTSTLIEEAHPSVYSHTPTLATDTTQQYEAALRRTFLPNMLLSQPLHHSSPILYTKTLNRTHLQIYTPSSDVEVESLTLEGAPTDKLIFGGVFVPSYSRRLTSYISNIVLKGNRNEMDELPAGFWDAQWRSMREERAKTSQRLTNETTYGSFSHTLEGNKTRVEDEEELEHRIRKILTNSKNVTNISVKASSASLDSGETKYPVRTSTTIYPSWSAMDNLGHDTTDSIVTRQNRESVENELKPSDRHTITGYKSINRRNKRKRRKLSETYIDVSLKRESSFSASSLPPRLPSPSSNDLLPDDPAFPILQGAISLRAH